MVLTALPSSFTLSEFRFETNFIFEEPCELKSLALKRKVITGNGKKKLHTENL
jgi:hypothetical protein